MRVLKHQPQPRRVRLLQGLLMLMLMLMLTKHEKRSWAGAGVGGLRDVLSVVSARIAQHRPSHAFVAPQDIGQD